MRVAVAALTLALGLGAGCSKTVTVAPAGPASPAGAEGGRDDHDDPAVRAARPDAEAFLNGLLAGQFDADPDYAPVAARVKGYATWAIRSERLTGEPGNPIDYVCVLDGPAGKADWAFRMTRQQTGKWMLSTADRVTPRGGP